MAWVTAVTMTAAMMQAGAGRRVVRVAAAVRTPRASGPLAEDQRGPRRSDMTRPARSAGARSAMTPLAREGSGRLPSTAGAVALIAKFARAVSATQIQIVVTTARLGGSEAEKRGSGTTEKRGARGQHQEQRGGDDGAASRGDSRGPAVWHLVKQQQGEEGGEDDIQAGGVEQSDGRGEDDADEGAGDPRRPLRERGAEQHATVKASLALVCQDPRAVHDRLSLDRAADPPALQRGRGGERHREEPQVDQRCRGDRGPGCRATPKHGKQRELSRAGKDRERRDHGCSETPAMRAGERAERHAEHERAGRQCCAAAHAGAYVVDRRHTPTLTG